MTFFSQQIITNYLKRKAEIKYKIQFTKCYQGFRGLKGLLEN